MSIVTIPHKEYLGTIDTDYTDPCDICLDNENEIDDDQNEIEQCKNCELRHEDADDI